MMALALQVKPGASVIGIQPPVLLAVGVACLQFHQVVLTSGTDVAPGRVKGSLHAVGLAVDLVIPGVSHPEVARVLRACLGGEFDVIAEDDHVHVEFQPDGVLSPE